MFTGFFWWLLMNGPRFATDIMTSLRILGGAGVRATEHAGALRDCRYWLRYLQQGCGSIDGLEAMDSLFGLLLSMAILIVFALIGVNMLLLLISGWIFAYAGVFILGFGVRGGPRTWLSAISNPF